LLCSADLRLTAKHCQAATTDLHGAPMRPAISWRDPRHPLSQKLLKPAAAARHTAATLGSPMGPICAAWFAAGTQVAPADAWRPWGSHVGLGRNVGCASNYGHGRHVRNVRWSQRVDATLYLKAKRWSVW